MPSTGIIKMISNQIILLGAERSRRPAMIRKSINRVISHTRPIKTNNQINMPPDSMIIFTVPKYYFWP